MTQRQGAGFGLRLLYDGGGGAHGGGQVAVVDLLGGVRSGWRASL